MIIPIKIKSKNKASDTQENLERTTKQARKSQGRKFKKAETRNNDKS